MRARGGSMAEKENFKLLISKEEWKNIAKYIKETETSDDKEDKSCKIVEKIKSFFLKKYKDFNIKKFLKKFLLLGIILLFNIIIYKKLNSLLIKYEDLAFGFIGPVLAALITVDGVFAGFYFNKKQTYKEIVTRERIEWLHKIQEKLALYLDLTSSDNEQRREKLEDNKKTVDNLYYEIIFNINHGKDEKAINALENYHMAYKKKKKKTKSKEETKDNTQKKFEDEDKFEIPLEKIDKEIFKIKNSKELEETYEIIIKKDELKDIKKDELKDRVIKEFVEIFYETWRDIKGEAD